MSTDGTTLGFLYDEGKTLFCFLVSGPIRVSLSCLSACLSVCVLFLVVLCGNAFL